MKPHSVPLRWALFACTLVLLSVAPIGARSTVHAAEFAVDGAPTIKKGQFEIGVFSASKWGMTKRVELGANPIGMFLLPAARAKISWWYDAKPSGHRHSTFWFSTLHRVSVPTPFLFLLSREGSMGLIPADTEIPFALQLENAAIVSAGFSDQLLSLSAGIGVAIEGAGDLPMIEFPFIYTTLAPLYAPYVLRGSLSLEGPLHGPFDYQVIYRMNGFRPYADLAWPDGPAPWVYAQETALRVQLRIGTSQRLSLGVTTSVAHYPVGYRFYWIPTVDYRWTVF